MSVLPAVISAVGGVLGSGLSSISQHASNKAYLKGVQQTNDTNLAIARENNDAAYKQFLESNAFTASQNDKQLAYNSAPAQLQRLRMAGLNPALIAGAGQASGSSGSVAPPARSVPSLSPPGQVPNAMSPLAQFVGGAVSDFLDNNYKSEQVSQERLKTQMAAIDRSFHYEHTVTRLNKEIADVQASNLSNRDKRVRLEYLRSELNDAQQMRSTAKQIQSAELERTLSETRYVELQSDAQRIVNGNLPDKLAAELDVSRSQAYALVQGVAVDFARIAADTANVIRQINSAHDLQRSDIRFRVSQLRQQWRQFDMSLRQQMREYNLSSFKANQAVQQFRDMYRLELGDRSNPAKQLGGAASGLLRLVAP